MRNRHNLHSILQRLKTGWFYLLTPGLALVFLAACSPIPLSLKTGTPVADRDLLSSIIQRGTLVIATETDYPPQSQVLSNVPRLESSRCNMSQYSSNQMVGFDVDVAIEVAHRLGVEPCFVTPAWSQLVSGNWGGRWDINVGSMVITPDRMEKLYFTQPYTSGAAVLFVHQENQTIKEPGDLNGKRIGVCSGCAYEAYLNGTLEIPGEQIEFKIKDATVVGYDTDTSALADLALGDGIHLDAVLTDPDTGQTAIRDGLPIKPLGEPIYHDYSSIVVDKKSSSDPLPLVLRITEVIQAMHKDGTLNKISQRYYTGDFTSPAAAFDIGTIEQLP